MEPIGGRNAEEQELRQLYGFRDKIHKQKEYFTKEIETLKKNQTEIWELKTSIKEIKNALKTLEIEQIRWKN